MWSNNFNGIAIYADGTPTGSVPTSARCKGSGGGSRGTIPAVSGTLETINALLDDILVVSAGTGGSSGTYSGPTNNDGNYWGQGGTGGMGGLVVTSTVFTTPFPPTASPGSASSDNRGGGGGGGGQGWGAGGGGGGADGDNGQANLVGSGGSGAAGINIVIVGVDSTTITLTDGTDINKLQSGDLIQLPTTEEVLEGAAPQDPAGAVDGNPETYAVLPSSSNNRYRWTIKQNEDGDYKIFTHGFAYSNWQIKDRKDDIEWVADEGNWDKVFEMINSGTSTIESIKYR